MSDGFAANYLSELGDRLFFKRSQDLCCRPSIVDPRNSMRTPYNEKPVHIGVEQGVFGSNVHGIFVT